MGNEVVLNTDGTETARPIARVQIVDKEAGTATDVDVKTCARAVICDKDIDLQTHLEALCGHAEDTTAHLTAEEKNGLETTTGAQGKADAALTSAKEYTDTKSVDLAASMNTETDAKITAALETAASDASTKANTAKTEAVTEATTIATEKAAAAEAAALAEAKEYADVVGGTKAPSEHYHEGEQLKPAAIEMVGGSDHGGYIDFHYLNSTDDFTTRIIEYGPGALYQVDGSVDGNSRAKIPVIATGSYVGAGTYGKDNPNTLTLRFKPKFVLIAYSSSLEIFGYMVLVIPDAGTATWSDNTLSWHSTLNADSQCNSSSRTYYWFALG